MASSKVTLQVDLKVGVGQDNSGRRRGSRERSAAGGQQDQLASTDAPPKLLNQELGKKLQAALEAAVASPDTKWPGAVLYVRAPGLGDWSGAAGLGEVKTNTAMRPHDRFRAGSLTKPFIAAVVLQLVEEGRFALDDPISKAAARPGHRQVRPTRPDHRAHAAQPHQRAARLHELGGTRAHRQPRQSLDSRGIARLRRRPRSRRLRPASPSTTRTRTMLLLGMIIEAATGRTWREELRQRIFEPLNLKDTLLPAPEEKRPAGRSRPRLRRLRPGPFDATELVTASVVGAAGGQSLVTNAPDLGRFIEALLAGRLFKKSGTLDEMLTFVKVPPDQFPAGYPLRTILTDYGLGLMKATYAGDLVGIGHSGDTEGGYHAFVFHFPKQDITIAGAVNMADPPGRLGAAHAARPGGAGAGIHDAATRRRRSSPMRAQPCKGCWTTRYGSKASWAWPWPSGCQMVRSSSGVPALLIPPGKTPGPWTRFPHWAVSPSRLQAWSSCNWCRRASSPSTTRSTRWFPDQPNGDKITVRMLLSHTSGLANFISVENYDGSQVGVMHGRRSTWWPKPTGWVRWMNPAAAPATTPTPNYIAVGIDRRKDHRQQLGAGGPVTHHRTPPSRAHHLPERTGCLGREHGAGLCQDAEWLHQLRWNCRRIRMSLRPGRPARL